jgi:membrane protease YdiL (CAAX protease family)
LLSLEFADRDPDSRQFTTFPKAERQSVYWRLAPHDMAVTGSLRDLSAEQLVNLLVVSRNTGVLSLESQGHKAAIYLEEGEPVYASLDEERIGLTQALRDSGKLTVEQLHIILSLSRATTDEELARLLVDAGIVGQDDILESLRSRILDMVERILAWDEGSFRFDPDKVLTAEPVAPTEAPELEAAEIEPRALALEEEAEKVEAAVEDVSGAPAMEEGEAEISAVEPSIPGPPAVEEEEPELAHADSGPPEGKPPVEEETTTREEVTVREPLLKRLEPRSARTAHGEEDVEAGGVTSSRHPSSLRRELGQLSSLEEFLSTVPALPPGRPLSPPTALRPSSAPEAMDAPSAAGAAASTESRFDQLASVLRLPRLAERQIALLIALGYLLLIAAAELIVTFVEPRVGLAIHGGVLIVLLIHSALASGHSYHGLLVSLSLAPLIRMVSLSMPLVEFPILLWYLIISVPLFAATMLAARNLGFSWDELGIAVRKVPVQILVGATGLLLGAVEYYILRPDPLVPVFSWQSILVPALILVACTGFGEELIFRGVLQRSSMRALGRFGWIYVAVVFAVLHVGYKSVADVLFVFGVALMFGWVVEKTRSLVGVTLAHGLTNVVLFLIMPFWAG